MIDIEKLKILRDELLKSRKREGEYYSYTDGVLDMYNEIKKIVEDKQ